MRKLIIVALFLVAGKAQAQQFDVWSMQNLHAASCPGVTITSGTVVEITGNSSNSGGKVYALAVFNTSTSADVFCGDKSSIAATVGQSNSGVPVMRAASSTSQPSAVQWLISTVQSWYCITNNASGAIVVPVCQYK